MSASCASHQSVGLSSFFPYPHIDANMLAYFLLIYATLCSGTANAQQNANTAPRYPPNDKNPFALTAVYTLEYDDRKGNFGASIFLTTTKPDLLSQLLITQFKFEDPSQSVVEVDPALYLYKPVETTDKATWHTFKPAAATITPTATTTLIRIKRATYKLGKAIPPTAPLRGPVNVLITFQQGANQQRAFFDLRQQYLVNSSSTPVASTNSTRDISAVRDTPPTEQVTPGINVPQEDPGVPVGMIAGIVGGLAFVGIFIVVIALSIRHRNQRLSRMCDPWEIQATKGDGVSNSGTLPSFGL